MNDKLQSIFRKILKEDELILTDELSERDLASWNSLNNILLINKIEESFEVKFDLSEILKIKNVGDIKDLLKRKLSN